MSESMFGRLFTYARAEGNRPIENFTTEALAAAIRVDPTPFREALARHGAIESARAIGPAVITTQEVIPGVGIVDLVVREFEGPTIACEIWVEVKIWAGESGDQLARYSRHLARLHDDVQRILITIGPRPIEGSEGIPWIPWQTLRDCVGVGTDQNLVWRELSLFLEERNVADQSTDPISPREVSSLRDAHGLFVKASKILTAVNELGKEQWPEWGWGGKDQVTQQILGQFQRQARMTIFTTHHPVYLIVGYTDLYATGEAHLTVWVESDPKKPSIRSHILEAAEAGGLEANWVRHLDTWQALGHTHRAGTIEGVDATVAWFTARLEELNAAGVGPDVAA